MKSTASDYNEEAVVVDGVSAIRRRKAKPVRQAREHYLHITMACVTALGKSGIPAAAWPLALWVIWHHTVAKSPACITTQFASRAGIEGRSARRHALAALEASGLFQVRRNGTKAVQVSPKTKLTAMSHTR